MANFAALRLTQLGEDLQAKVQAGATLTFAHISLGSGIWSDPQDVNAMTALVNPETTIPITQVRSLGNGQWLVQGVIDTDDFIGHGYDHTECGIYATDPDLGDILYMATNATEPDHIPSDTDGVAYSTVLNFVQTISDQVTVTVVVDNASAATLYDFNNHINDAGAHGATDLITPSSIVRRDADGQTNFSAPSQDTHVFRKIDGDRITPKVVESVWDTSPNDLPSNGATTTISSLPVDDDMTVGDIGLVSLTLMSTKLSTNDIVELFIGKLSGSGELRFTGITTGARVFDAYVEAGNPVSLDLTIKFSVITAGSYTFKCFGAAPGGLSLTACGMDVTWLYKQS